MKRFRITAEEFRYEHNLRTEIAVSKARAAHNSLWFYLTLATPGLMLGTLESRWWFVVAIIPPVLGGLAARWWEAPDIKHNEGLLQSHLASRKRREMRHYDIDVDDPHADERLGLARDGHDPYVDFCPRDPKEAEDWIRDIEEDYADSMEQLVKAYGSYWPSDPKESELWLHDPEIRYAGIMAKRAKIAERNLNPDEDKGRDGNKMGPDAESSNAASPPPRPRA